MRISRTMRRLPKETVQLERFTGRDAEGAPGYATPIDCVAHVVMYAAGGSRFGERHVPRPDGQAIEAPLTLYVQGDASVVPEEQDRVQLAGDERHFIVLEKKEVAAVSHARTEPDHYRCACVLEGASLS